MQPEYYVYECSGRNNCVLNTLFNGGGLTSLFEDSTPGWLCRSRLGFLKTREMLRSKTRLRLPAWSRMPSSRAPWLHLSGLCTWLCGRRESPSACFLQPRLASGLLWWRGSEERTRNSKPIVEVKDVSQSGWSKASVALEGREGPEPKKGGVLPKEVAGLGVVGLLLQSIHLNAKSAFIPGPCASEAGGAGAAPQNVCQRSAGAGGSIAINF
jgi:hypothetical protein